MVLDGGLLPLPKPPRRLRSDLTKLRVGGGQLWQDHSLEDWDHSERYIAERAWTLHYSLVYIKYMYLVILLNL